jgi:D-psicose/D-tagatose/L-ribulose 3-epimerase
MAVDHPSCKMMYDTFHANIEEKSQAGAFNSCKEHVCHIHISENDRGIPGTGQIHWDEFWAALKASDYSGYLTIEAFGSALPNIAAATKIWRDIFPDSMQLAREGLAFIKKNAGI